MIRHLARRALLAGAIVIVSAAALAMLVAHVAPGYWSRLTAHLLEDNHLSAAAVDTAATTALRVLVPIAAAALVGAAVCLCGRVAGRYLRRPYPPADWLPARPARGLSAARDQMAPVAFEIRLGRDSLAEPYEVAKLFDGLSGVLRPRARFSLRSFLGPDPLCFVFAWDASQRRMRLLLQAPPARSHAITDRLRIAYRDVELDRCEPIRLPAAPAVVRLKKRSRSLRALQTTKDYQHSVVESLLGAMHAERVDVVVQLAITPTSARREKRASAALTRRESQFIAQKGYDANDPGIASAVAQKTIKGALEGVGRALYWFDLRICVDGAQPDAALRVAGVLNEARQDNELHPRVTRARRRLVARRIDLGILSPLPGVFTGAVSGAELATLWHLPSIRVRGVGLQRMSSRQLDAPPTICRDERTAVGYDRYGPVGIKDADRRYGWAIMGAAGGGKTSLMIPDFANAARDGDRAVIVVDPKEDLARDALHLAPADRVVHYLDLGKPYAGFNVLALHHLPPQVRADILIAALRETAGEGSIQSRSDEFLRAAITAVCVVENTPTLFHVRRILDPFDSGYRDWVVRELASHDEVDFLRDYWEREYPAMVAANARFVAEAVNAPRNKISRFLAVPSLALLVTHPVQIDLERIIDRREILVINGSKGAVGEDNAVLFGQLVILQLQKTLHQIQRRDRNARFPVRLIVDEAHNFFTPSFATMLSEGRSARLEVTAAFQYTEQIQDDRVKAGIKSLLQNVSVTRMKEFEDARNVAALAMEVFADNIRGESEDQRRLTIDPLDIINMPNWRPLHLWLVDNAPQPAFTAHTWEVEPMIATDQARARAAAHLAAQRSRGWHPHDHGQPIAPPVVWTKGRPVLLQRRTLHVDLAAWPQRRSVVTCGVVVALQRGGGSWAGYEALPTDAQRKRWTITIPAEPTADGWLPDDTYAVNVIVTDIHGDEHVWTPMVEAVDDGRPPEPIQVALHTVAPFSPTTPPVKVRASA